MREALPRVVAVSVAIAVMLGPAARLRGQDRRPTQPMPVLILAPTRSEAKAQWFEIARGLRDVGLLPQQVSDLPIDPVFAACRSAACAAEAAHVAGMPALIGTAQKGIVELRWVAPDDGVWTERAVVTQGGLAAASAEVARRILLRRALGARALLRVESQPAGALVFIDGKLAGLTPLEQAWEPGERAVEVALEGYESEHASAALAAGEVREIRFELQAKARAEGFSDAPQRTRASPLNFVLGSVLGVAALPLLIGGANAYIDEGQCLQSRQDVCTQRADAGPVEAAMLGLGAASVAGAAYLFVAQPLRVRVEATPHYAGLQLRWRM